jgi:sorbitol-specific phosphotransferase system component IIA
MVTQRPAAHRRLLLRGRQVAVGRHAVVLVALHDAAGAGVEGVGHVVLVECGGPERARQRPGGVLGLPAAVTVADVGEQLPALVPVVVEHDLGEGGRPLQ